MHIFYLKASGQTGNKKTVLPPSTKNGKDAEQSYCKDESLLKNIETEGLRLGMSKSEINRILPSANWTYNKAENTSFTALPNSIPFPNSSVKDNDKSLPPNVVEISLDLFGDKLFYYHIAYDKSKTWASVQEYIEFLSDKYNLPKNYWRFTNERSAIITCGTGTKIASSGLYSLEVWVNEDATAGLVLKDWSYYSEIRKYKEANNKQKRKP
jgi:hypothetical protein